MVPWMFKVKNIILTGFMGAGKSAVGRELARMAGLRLVELDAEIERAAGLRIPEIFAREGELAFREREAREVGRAAGLSCVVISTGGGAVMREDNREALRRAGVVVYLKTSPEVIFTRTQLSDRPLLKTADPMATIRELLARREPFYAMADIVIETDGLSPMDVAREILSKMEAAR